MPVQASGAGARIHGKPAKFREQPRYVFVQVELLSVLSFIIMFGPFSLFLILLIYFYFFIRIFIYFSFRLFYYFTLNPRQEPAHNFERDIQRILKEQELVTKRSREFETRLPISSTSSPSTTSTTTMATATSPTSPLISQPIVTKVGFAAVQEMARLQEQEELREEEEDATLHEDSNEMEQSPEPSSSLLLHDSSDLSFLRFNPDFNKSPLSASPPKAPSSLKNPKNVFAKFPLEIPTPIHSPKVGLKRFGSFRYDEKEETFNP